MLGILLARVDYFNFIKALKDEAKVDMKKFEPKDLVGQSVKIEKRSIVLGGEPREKHLIVEIL